MASNEQPQAEYREGASISGTSKILDENIICTIIRQDKSAVLSLAPVEEGSRTQFELCTTHLSSVPQEFVEKHQFEGLPTYLRPGNTIYILISTLSGTGLASHFFDDVLRPVLLGVGLSNSRYNVLRTESTESIIEFARDTLLPAASEGEKQTVLLLSGDGGLVDIINGLLENRNRSSSYQKPILAQLPLGTGNALFHSLHKSSSAGVPSIYIQALRTLLRGEPKPLPLFRANFSPSARLLTNEARTVTPLKNDALYGAVVASYGLHSTLVADSDTTEYRKHGDKRFGLVAKDLLFPDDGALPHAYLAEVTLTRDGRKETVGRLEHGYVLASLVSNLEKTFTISPESQPLDGSLRVVHFDALSGEDTMKIMTAAYDSGKHTELSGVGYQSVDSMRIDFKEPGESWKWRRCCVDGLIVGVEEGGWMEVSLLGTEEGAVDMVAD